MVKKINFSELLEAGVHFGHSRRYWNSKMTPYLYGVRKKVHIINILKTKALMERAIEYLTHVASSNGKILYVGTKRQAQDLIREQAERVGMPYVNKRWPGGMLTNFKTILQSVERMKSLEGFLASDEVFRLKKKERLSLERDLAKLNASFGGIRDMPSLPDCLFVIDVGQEHIAVSEAVKLGIPVVAVVDTNCSPDGVDYIIPGNDDSQKAIQLYLSSATDSVEEVVSALRKKAETRAVVTSSGKEVKVVKKKTDAEAVMKDEKDAKHGAAVEIAQEEQSEPTHQVAAPSKKRVVKVSVEQVRKAHESEEVSADGEKPAAKKASKAKSKSEPKEKKVAVKTSKPSKKADADAE